MKKSLLLVALVTVFATSFGTTSADASSKESSIGTLAACVKEERSFAPGVYIPQVIKSGNVYLELKVITKNPDGSSTVLYVQKEGCTSKN
ncbi:hypothetical protein [Brevibacillus laterosporus]|uniref:hypothetical protein n=1 Tax=Brevibacillus laterosporus TaxID=1465 RepID=UPI0018CE02C2|nr:hypothetical protein [Brevibacillus laterosporus]MBG9790262.1 hypothetical protein [Brevibacillus laterosporus]